MSSNMKKNGIKRFADRHILLLFTFYRALQHSQLAVSLLAILCMGNMTRSLAMICVFSVQVRVVAPFLGPPSDYAVVKMIPNEKLPPRNLHRVQVDKTQATLKWQPPYDSPSKPLVHSRLLL